MTWSSTNMLYNDFMKTWFKTASRTRITHWSCKTVNGFRYYRALESVSTYLQQQLCLPLLPFTHARSESINADSLKLQLPTAQKNEWRPATAGSSPHAVTCQHCDTHYTLVGLEPTTFRSLVRRAIPSHRPSDHRMDPLCQVVVAKKLPGLIICIWTPPYASEEPLRGWTNYGYTVVEHRAPVLAIWSHRWSNIR